ncbi:MAG: helix-turn-helix transcriptional regulator [Planctomycetota bacterium]
MATATVKKRRRGRRPAQQLSRPDYPFVMKLADGRRLFIEIPGRLMTEDRGGEPAFLPGAVKLIDQAQVLAMSLDTFRAGPSPGYITTLREALGMTQQEFGEKVNVDKMTVSRWERGTVRPSVEALKRIEKLRRGAVRRGVSIPG